MDFISTILFMHSTAHVRWQSRKSLHGHKFMEFICPIIPSPEWVGKLQICTCLGFLILFKHVIGFIEPTVNSETHRRWPKQMFLWAETSLQVANPTSGQTSPLVKQLIKKTLPRNLYTQYNINMGCIWTLSVQFFSCIPRLMFAGRAGNPCMGINLWNLYAPSFLAQNGCQLPFFSIDHTLQINKS